MDKKLMFHPKDWTLNVEAGDAGVVADNPSVWPRWWCNPSLRKYPTWVEVRGTEFLPGYFRPYCLAHRADLRGVDASLLARRDSKVNHVIKRDYIRDRKSHWEAVMRDRIRDAMAELHETPSPKTSTLPTTPLDAACAGPRYISVHSGSERLLWKEQ